MVKLSDVIRNINSLKKNGITEKYDLVEGTGYTEELVKVKRTIIGMIETDEDPEKMGFIKVAGKYYKKIDEKKKIEVTKSGKKMVVVLIEETRKKQVTTRVKIPKNTDPKEIEERVRQLGYNELLLKEKVLKCTEKTNTEYEKKTITLSAPTYICIKRASILTKKSISDVINALFCS